MPPGRCVVPMLPLDQKKAIRAANDIVDVVSSYIPVSVAGKDHKAICPFHNDTRPSLQISRQYQNFRCWSCDAKGDVFDFVMKQEKVEFGEALRMLAERAGIPLGGPASPEDEARTRLLRAMAWAEGHYARCLLDDPLAEAAREYLGERQLAGSTVRQFGLGFAPKENNWLLQLAHRDGLPLDVLVEVGLIGTSDEGRTRHYDRFRDRIMFPIRDVRGRTVGFGGRILPSSPLAARGPKYYNSAETPLFKKSELIYGLDLARHPASAAGVLAVVEGYTDAMMAHQCGVQNVVGTMGTALTAQHVAQLRRYAPKVVLVYDADAGGEGGVDRALELFVSQDIELAVAALPDGLDPCDLLVQPDGVAKFQQCLSSAQDALDFKLNRMLEKEAGGGIDGTRRIADAVLGTMALAPPVPSRAGQVRQELIVTRIAQRLGLRQETVWARLAELKNERATRPEYPSPNRSRAAKPAATGDSEAPKVGTRQAAAERQLLQVLLADPGLVEYAKANVPVESIAHSGLRRLLAEMYDLQTKGIPPDLDALRVPMNDRKDLLDAADRLLEVGRHMTDRFDWLKRVVATFGELKNDEAKRDVKQALASGTDDDAAVELLRQLQARP